MADIALGNYTQQNGKNVLIGGASKLDTKSIIDALAAAKRAPAVRLEDSNKTIDKQTAAIAQMKKLVTAIQTAADTLRNPPGVAIDSKDIFKYSKASVTSSTGAAASNYLDVAVQPGAVAQSYTIDSITRLAQATKQQSNLFNVADSTTASVVTAGATAGMFKAGTINLRAVDGTVGGIPLTLTAGDSLETVAAKFNELSSRTGIQASVLTVASGQYQMIFSATKTGTTYGFDLGLTAPAANAGIASDPAGVLGQLTFATQQAAANAQFSIDGVTINRETNSISDVLNGVTFTLKQPAVPGTLNVNIVPDTSLVANAVTQFADAYNAFKLFVSAQTQVGDDGQPTADAVLYHDTTMRQLNDDISAEVSRIISGITTAGEPTQLNDIGIKLDDFQGDDKNPATKNILVVDTDALNSKLISDFNGVRQLFEFQASANDSNLIVSKRSNNLTVSNFTIAIDTTTSTYTVSYTDSTGSHTDNLTGTLITGGGVSLKGQSGSVFDGMEFVYATTAASVTTSVNVAASQGFGDRFYNFANAATDAASGSITNALSALATKKTSNTDEITKIDDRITSYRDQLVTQYASLESAISKANGILALLTAQSNAKNSG